MRRSLPLLFASLVAPVATPLVAQATLVVDAFGGPGTFPTLAAAEQAAIDGDTILVVPTATYDFGLTTAKGLTILGAATTPTQFHGRLVVDGLPAGRQFVLRNFVSGALPLNAAVGIQDCAGRVVLEDLLLTGPQMSSGFGQALAIATSRDVSAHRLFCLGGLTVTVFESRLVASESTFLGNPVTTSPVATVGLAVYGGEAHLTNVDLAANAFGLEASSSSGVPSMVTMAGGSVAGAMPITPPALLFPGSVLRVDAATAVIGPMTGSPPGSVVAHESGRVMMTLAAPGQLGSIAFEGPVGGAGALALGLPGAPASTPIGDLWLDPANFVIVAAGALPLQASVPMPAAALGAQVLVAQGLLVHQGALRLSGPVRATLP